MFGLTPYNKKNNELISSNEDFFNMGSIMERFFSDPFFPSLYQEGSMKVDVKETEKEYAVEAELPGVNKEDISVDFKEDRLTISVEKKEQVNIEKENYIRKERRYGAMSRSFYIENVESENVQAKFENGILSIRLPKKENQTVKKSSVQIE